MTCHEWLPQVENSNASEEPHKEQRKLVLRLRFGEEPVSFGGSVGGE